MDSEHEITCNGFISNDNYVWGGALTIAWKQLIDKFAHQPIEVMSQELQVIKIVQNFNKCKFSHKDIEAQSIYIQSGYGQSAVSKINQEVKKKFPLKTFQQLKCELGPLDIICYAYLFKNLQFKVKFQTQKGRKFLFQGKQTPSFYAKNKKQKQQIKWHYYHNKDEFMISIESKNSKDMIYFVKDHKVTSLYEAFYKVNNYEGKNSHKLGQIDFFEMPIVQLDVKRNVQKLTGKRINNKKLSGYRFSIVYEAIRLKINESGAKVQNQAVITLEKKKLVAKQKLDPKYFILDKQFWVVIKEEEHHPYLGVLIKSPLGL